MRLFVVAFCVSDNESVTKDELATMLQQIMTKVSKRANGCVKTAGLKVPIFLNHHPNSVLTYKRLKGTLI